MTQKINGPGVGLPLPQNLYPSQLTNAPYDQSTNKVALAPGDTLPIPAGEWLINLSQYLVMQFLDPVTGTWMLAPNAGWDGGNHFVVSDGFNIRIANLLGCPVTATVAAYGSAYVQASTSISVTGAAAGSSSTWLPIVGGQLTSTIISAGAGYGVPPEVFIPAPPPANNNPNGVGGIPASGFCVLSSGTLNVSSGFSFTNPGAGYPTAFTVVALPSPTDPNLSTGITLATIVFSITGSGSITGALCTNNGSALSNPNQITLTVAGAGSSGSLTANVLQTVTAASTTGTGTGFGTVAALLTTVGGVPVAGSISNNEMGLGLAWRPRPAQVGIAITGVGTIAAQLGTIYDGGMFLTNGAPTPVLQTNPAAAAGSVVAPTIALTMGSRADVATLQPAP